MIAFSIENILQPLLNEEEAAGRLARQTGIAVAALRGSKAVWTRTWGLRARDLTLPVTEKTRFALCSGTKAFVAHALLASAQENQWDLHAPINASSPLLPLSDADVTRQITAIDILSHQAGLPANDLYWHLGCPTASELLQSLAHFDVIPGAFRKTFIYNNNLYGALGHLFQARLGESWQAAVHRHLIAPLGLTATTCETPTEASDLALPYNGTQAMPSVDLAAVGPAGAMYSSLEDVCRWMSALLEPTDALSQKIIQEMQTPQIAVDGRSLPVLRGLEWLGQDLHYGLGWFIGQVRGHKAVFLPGHIDGFSCAFVLIPEKKWGFAALTNNNGSAIAGQIIERLVDAFLAQEEAEMSAQMTSARTPTTQKNQLVRGEYLNPSFGKLVIEADAEDNLTFNYKGRRFAMSWASESTAHAQIHAAGSQFSLPVEFKRDAEGQAHQLAVPLSLDPRVAPQVFTLQPAASTSA